MSVAPWITDESPNLPTARSRRKTRGTVSTAPRLTIFMMVVRHMFGFAFLCCVFFGLAALTGHSLKTSVGISRASAELRTDDARADVIALGGQLAKLTSIEELDRWAAAHGFARPGGHSGTTDEKEVHE